MPSRTTAKPEANDLQAQIAELRAQIAQLTQALAARDSGHAETLMQDLQRRAAELGDKAAAALRDKAAPATELAEAVTEYARQEPVKAMAMATGAGMLLGLLFGRR